MAIKVDELNLKIYRGLDFVLSMTINVDLTGATVIAECRSDENPLSDLICNLGASLGSYDSQTGLTPISLFVPRSTTTNIVPNIAYWSLVIKDVSNVAEPYVVGFVSILNDPTGSTSDLV